LCEDYQVVMVNCLSTFSNEPMIIIVKHHCNRKHTVVRMKFKRFQIYFEIKLNCLGGLTVNWFAYMEVRTMYTAIDFYIIFQKPCILI